MRPLLSIVVIFHDMQREAERTLYSLSVEFQEGVDQDDYEVVAIDNGSSQPLDEAKITKFCGNFRYHFFNTVSKSPAEALNLGSRLAKGENICFIVDGARMATPGLIASTIGALRTLDAPLITALSWHLGPKIQRISMLDGYCQATEDVLLASVDWENNGYKLFDISTIAPSSAVGFLGGMPSESSYLCLRKSSFLNLGGYCEDFRSPGGGLINHDLLIRALDSNQLQPLVILGEGVFHQFHGGVATNGRETTTLRRIFDDEYIEIRGKSISEETSTADANPKYFGMMCAEAMRFIKSP